MRAAAEEGVSWVGRGRVRRGRRGKREEEVR
jgi:hypothetical protein